VAIRVSERDDNLIYLTVALLGLLFLIAVAEQAASVWGAETTRFGILSVLGVAIWTARGDRVLIRSGLSVLAMLVLLSVINLWLSNAGLRLAQLVLVAWLFGGIAWLAFKQVLFTPGAIDANRLLGAISIYLLLGLIWAICYVGILDLDAGAFNGADAGPWLESIPEFVYFSFVSLTTLGYGDISPATPLARFAVYLEAIVGQLYLAIMVAGLVGIGISDRTANRSE
jgi:hypothetical protein